jgi:uncharacterized protein (TIGR00645 family)
MKLKILTYLSRLLFFGRWLQAPLYFGLIIILAAYAYRFISELFMLVKHMPSLNDSQVMLGVLDLIDVVMIANLLIMVIVGGYENFVSHLHLQNHPDKPEWLEEMNAGAMKVKLALALVGISSIHLLRTFIDPAKLNNFSIMWQVIIHLTLVVSAIAIAFSNRLVANGHAKTS